jgi:hypothetical protein
MKTCHFCFGAFKDEDIIIEKNYGVDIQICDCCNYKHLKKQKALINKPKNRLCVQKKTWQHEFSKLARQWAIDNKVFITRIPESFLHQLKLKLNVPNSVSYNSMRNAIWNYNKDI